MDGVRALAVGRQAVAQPDVRECAAHHHLVMAAPRAIRVELEWRPANANATTRGGEARYDARASGWIRPSKLRLPDSTAATTRSLSSTAFAIGSSSGPLLPMHVVQP